MPIEKIESGMNEWVIASALLLSPSSHPDVWVKRVTELHRQGRHDEAAIVETEFAHKLTGAKEWERRADAIASWLEGI